MTIMASQLGNDECFIPVRLYRQYGLDSRYVRKNTIIEQHLNSITISSTVDEVDPDTNGIIHPLFEKVYRVCKDRDVFVLDKDQSSHEIKTYSYREVLDRLACHTKLFERFLDGDKKARNALTGICKKEYPSLTVDTINDILNQAPLYPLATNQTKG